MTTATAPDYQWVAPLAIAEGLIVLANRATDEGRDSAPYLTLAEAIIDSVDADDYALAQQWVDGAIAWIGRAS